MKKPKRTMPWPVVLAVQAGLACFASGACVLLPVILPHFSAARVGGYYIALPLCGAFLACWGVRRRLYCLAAWLAPVAAFITVYAIWMGTLPPWGPALALFGAALLGAAAGEVLNQRK